MLLGSQFGDSSGGGGFGAAPVLQAAPPVMNSPVALPVFFDTPILTLLPSTFPPVEQPTHAPASSGGTSSTGCEGCGGGSSPVPIEEHSRALTMSAPASLTTSAAPGGPPWWLWLLVALVILSLFGD